ncbi:MAG: DUF4417 domain-containing protein [Erysipelotrichaceae bacterium]|nr:DUF4417 domain-containing protein [Erysipelotrichaceae bacterium]
MKYSLEFKRDRKDVFGAYMMVGAEYDVEHYDIPYVDVRRDIILPDKLISYSKVNLVDSKENVFVHFYQDDYIFDGTYGIWNALLYDNQFKKGFCFEKLDKVSGIICPDYSIYGDMPKDQQIWNVGRSRRIGSYFNRIGIPAIPNVHWLGPESYEYCFAGLRKNTIVAVSTLGCLRSNLDKSIFMPGLQYLIDSIVPDVLIIYGSLTEEIRSVLSEKHAKYLYFPSEISEAMEAKYGNERK